jgi:hypothetical protein
MFSRAILRAELEQQPSARGHDVPSVPLVSLPLTIGSGAKGKIRDARIPYRAGRGRRALTG